MSILKWKVCGMRETENIGDLVRLQPDYIGFIFYPKSKRYAEELDPAIVHKIPSDIKKVGVFVNESYEKITSIVAKYNLDYVQLHGDESPAFCEALKTAGINVIKVFRIADHLPDTLSSYVDVADLFLFDTDTKNYGGSGQHFDWSLLEDYPLHIPYLLSGGIEKDDVEQIKQLGHKQLIGIDVNSKFEMRPGYKDLQKLKRLKEEL